MQIFSAPWCTRVPLHRSDGCEPTDSKTLRGPTLSHSQARDHDMNVSPGAWYLIEGLTGRLRIPLYEDQYLTRVVDPSPLLAATHALDLFPVDAPVTPDRWPSARGPADAGSPWRSSTSHRACGER